MISLKFVPKGPINYISALVQTMAWHRPGDTPLSEPMMVILLTHIWVFRPQWVKYSGAFFQAVAVRCCLVARTMFGWGYYVLGFTLWVSLHSLDMHVSLTIGLKPGLYFSRRLLAAIAYSYVVIAGDCGQLSGCPNAPWWRHQMETFSVLLALCEGNSPVSGEFTAQSPVIRSFDVFFDLRRNKRLSTQAWGWWFETLSRPLWRHRNDSSAPQVSL